MRSQYLATLVAVLLCACATVPAVPPLTVDQALAMAKSGQSVDSIIESMRVSHSSYRLSASDVIRLHDAGMPTPVLDYMLQSQTDEARAEQHYRDVDLYPPPFYWGWRRW